MRERPHREHPHTHPPSWRFTRWLRLCVSSRLARQAPHLSDHAIPKIGRETGSKAHALRSTRLEPSSPDGGPPRTIPSSGKKNVHGQDQCILPSKKSCSGKRRKHIYDKL